VDAHSGALSRKAHRASVEHPSFDVQGKFDDVQSAAHSAHKPHEATEETWGHSAQRPHRATEDTSRSANERTERRPAPQSIGGSHPLNGQQQGLQGFWPWNGLYDKGWGNRSDWDERVNEH
jgi:hypothetical protein